MQNDVVSIFKKIFSEHHLTLNQMGDLIVVRDLNQKNTILFQSVDMISNVITAVAFVKYKHISETIVHFSCIKYKFSQNMDYNTPGLT
jgi:hypothetical protein